MENCFLENPYTGTYLPRMDAQMTKRSKYLHKLGNAWRAMRGTSMALPQKQAKARVERWITRCRARGYVTFSDKPS